LRDAVRVRVFRRPFRAGKQLVRRYLDALAPLGLEAPTRQAVLHVAERDAEKGRDLMERHGVGGGPIAVVVPGSAWATKRWPAVGYARLAALMASELGLRVVLVGSSDERELCDEVALKAGDGAVNVAGEATLGVTAAVIAGAAVFVGNDSGPTHMAMALGVPSVAIFGPTDPGQFDFRGHELVYRDLACSACSFYGSERCHLGHRDCMLSIAPEEVLESVSRLLGQAGGGR
jgi:ADP-heptose:LPS heptosyltransferase